MTEEVKTLEPIQLQEGNWMVEDSGHGTVRFQSNNAGGFQAAIEAWREKAIDRFNNTINHEPIIVPEDDHFRTVVLLYRIL